MYKQEINTVEDSEICCKCLEWNHQRIKIGRLEIMDKKKGFIIANDLFDSVICLNCFILHVQNAANELQATTKARTKPKN